MITYLALASCDYKVKIAFMSRLTSSSSISGDAGLQTIIITEASIFCFCEQIVLSLCDHDPVVMSQNLISIGLTIGRNKYQCF